MKKKINNSSVNQKDRIVCVALSGELVFYYQTFGNGKRIALFREKTTSPFLFQGQFSITFARMADALTGIPVSVSR